MLKNLGFILSPFPVEIENFQIDYNFFCPFTIN